MSKNGGVLNAIEKILIYIVLVLLILGLTGGAMYLAMRGQGMTYYVGYGGKQYLANGDGGSLGLVNGETHTFTVKSLTGGEVNYDVKITANNANNFDFVSDGEYWQFYGKTDENNDYSAVFGLQKKADSFSLILPAHFTVKQAIEQKYGKPVEVLNGYEISNELSYFVITVTSDKSTVSMWFTFSDFTVTFDSSQIVF